MLIEFRCGHYSRFDKKTGQYVVCGQKMSASSDDAGLVVTCPKCNKDCEVPIPKRKKQESVAQKPAAVSSGIDSGIANAEHDPIGAPSKQKVQRCPKCGGLLDERGACSACRWVKPRFVKAKQSLDEMVMEPAGMMLWFSQIMSEGVPMKFLSIAGIILVPLLLGGLMAFSLFVVGGVFGGLLFLVFFVLLLLFVGMTYKGYHFLRSGHAQLAWFQKPFWYGMLAFCRSRKWQGFDHRYRNRNVVSFRGEAITDAKLVQRKEFKTAQVLDLEGTLVTDGTIEQLYHLKHLQCLVVKKTQVSHLAVTRLQQSFPKMWIWH